MRVFDISLQPRRALGSKVLLWPTARGHGELLEFSDSAIFPSITSIKARYSSHRREPLYAFISAIAEARERVLVVDDYLFRPSSAHEYQDRVNQVLDWFQPTTNVGDVRIITSGQPSELLEKELSEQAKERAERINRTRVYGKRLSIHIKFTLTKNFPYIHDRFAIVDDELWHFGATVGGLHEKMNAASRGWSAEDCQALKVFDQIWFQELTDKRLQSRRT